MNGTKFYSITIELKDGLKLRKTTESYDEAMVMFESWKKDDLTASASVYYFAENVNLNRMIAEYEAGKYHGYKIVYKSGTTYEKRYKKEKTQNQLRYLAVSHIVNYDLNRHGFHIEYLV